MRSVDSEHVRISPTQADSMLSAAWPALEDAWEEEGDLYVSEDGTRTLCAALTVLSHAVADRLAGGAVEGLQPLFGVVERLLEQGTADVENAVETCFLENLVNRTPDAIDPKYLIVLLGPVSRVHCRKWDAFTGRDEGF